MAEFERIRVEQPDDGVARVILARAEKRNAQDKLMLYELDEAFTAVMRDPTVKVMILAADGPDFSCGHDLSADWWQELEAKLPTGRSDEPGQYETMSMEEEYYLGFSWRWRNLPKPTIAQVQGRVIAGGLMLVFPMDLIVASEDALFSDPVLAFNNIGNEYFTHVWEFGPRKAKEILFTGAALTARECADLGMVNHVVPLEELESFTLDLARRITTRPAFGLKLAKSAVNQSMDAQGQWTAIQAAFSLHQLAHANVRAVHAANPDAGAVGEAMTKMIRDDAKAGVRIGPEVEPQGA